MTSLFFNIVKLKENVDLFVLEQEGMFQIVIYQQYYVYVCVCVYKGEQCIKYMYVDISLYSRVVIFMYGNC